MQFSKIKPTRHDRFAILNTKVHPRLIARAFRYDENEVWRYMEDVRVSLNECAQERDERAVYKEALAFRDEFPQEFRKEMRVEHLKNQLRRATWEYERACMALAEKKTDDHTHAERAEKKLHAIRRELQVIDGHESGISKQTVDRARDYDITLLIPNERFMACCPFHADKTASMYLKNNFYHCFGCGAHGDSIDLVMKTKNLTFPEAVTFLTNA